ncbi:MAG: hypothetical protein JKX76_03740 [Colwellia sp.]|nr:hypothetical protein [Colwellia sp.]
MVAYNHEISEYKKSNREKKLTSVKGQYFCGADCQIVSAGKKCPCCGTPVGKKTIKKETNAK